MHTETRTTTLVMPVLFSSNLDEICEVEVVLRRRYPQTPIHPPFTSALGALSSGTPHARLRGGQTLQPTPFSR